MKSLAQWMAVVTILVGAVTVKAADSGPVDERPLVMVVMDPLSAKLACDCVKGYAQRKYEKLGEHLQRSLKRKVDVVWGESLANAGKDAAGRPADLVVGKYSVVLADARQENWPAVPIASLTGKDGKTTQTGLIVVRKDDPAQGVENLNGYRIIFGPADCDEKSAAPLALLRSKGIEIAGKPETADTCSIAATCLVELPEGVKAAAVISSYAEPLLAGCGTIKQGDLRIVAVTAPVPFVAAFASGNLSPADRAAIRGALLQVGEHPDLLAALETKAGFVPFIEPQKIAETKKK
jgi:ABC-type phosphate/phosphonate transport system substrate-binding protein